MGSFLNTDTTRVIAKRIVLSGHPLKVHRKTATVRYLFFNAGMFHLLPFFLNADGSNSILFLLQQTTYSISSPFSCTQSTGGPDTSRSLLARMATSKRTSMGRSRKWTQCAWRCTSVHIHAGARSGRRIESQQLLLATKTTGWKSENPTIVILDLLYIDECPSRVIHIQCAIRTSC